MKIISETKDLIFRNENDGKVTYSIGISTKVDGKYINSYFPVRFKKGIEPTMPRTYIKIINAFMTFSTFTDAEGKEKKYQYIMVTDYSQEAEVVKNEEQKTDPFEQFGNEVVIPDSDLPF